LTDVADFGTTLCYGAFMGTSTNGQLSFGVAFDEDFEFPWSDEKYEGDIEEWWRDVRGFVNPIECPFDDRGDYKPGINTDSPVISEYFAKQREWETANPIPVELVNYCSGDYPMWIIAAKHMENCRGTPQKVTMEFIRDTDEAFQRLSEFLDKYGIESENEPDWWLTSYWG
jgi:hypothetical protein